MALDTHWKVLYGDTILALAGFQKRSLLKQFVTHASKKGETVYFDSDSPDDEADYQLMSGLTHFRADYEEIGAPTLSDFEALFTPHKNILKARTQCVPYENEFAHWFRNIDEIAENANNNSRVLLKGMQRIVRNQDSAILTAALAETQSRGKDAASQSAVAFPTGQIIDPVTGLTIEQINNVRRLFEDNYCADEPIYMVISPVDKEALINANGSTIHSKDFVSPMDFFERGTLPNIYGVHIIVHPLLGESQFYNTAGDRQYVAWSQDAITYNQFDGLQTRMEEDPGQRFQIVLEAKEYIGTCRCDDLRVVKGSIDITP